MAAGVPVAWDGGQVLLGACPGIMRGPCKIQVASREARVVRHYQGGLIVLQLQTQPLNEEANLGQFVWMAQCVVRRRGFSS